MFQKYKKDLILSSLVTLLPIPIGLMLWDQLPDVMATHWGINHQADGFSSKGFAVFGMPFIMLGLQWLMLWITSKDPGHKNQNKKAFRMVFWMIPTVSLVIMSIMYGIALGNTINLNSAIFIILGLMFMGIGNYMPKVKQNYSLGIKVIWTLNSEENWNATHRFCGRIWFFGGLILMLAGLLSAKYANFVFLPVLFVMALIPMLYSYLYYKKQCKEGRGYSLKVTDKDKKTAWISTVCVILILIFAAYFMFSGEIACSFDETGFTVLANHYDDLTVEYDSVDSIELRSEPIPGTRRFGFGSAKLLLGVFENEEFGLYTRYTYTGCECAIIIRCEDKVLVVAAKTPEHTEILYKEFLSRIP